MPHILDRPIWSALETDHADLAEGGKSARRYPPSIVPFAASADDTPESLDALENLPSREESMILVESGPIAIPPGLAVMTEASVVQMVAERPHGRISDSRIEPLTETDAADMLALATLTKPGPFTLRAQSLGSFWGIRSEGRLVAMAG
jgi:hypothetical protein